MRGLLIFALALASCSRAETWSWDLPATFALPRVPDDNAMSTEKVELGRRLFYDKRLSYNEEQSCSSCHDQALAFADGKTHPIGSTGQEHRRNSPGLANVAYFSSLTWANPLVETLERQALLPLLGETPVELGWEGKEQALFARLSAQPDYVARFSRAFPELDGEISLKTITFALAAFERTMISKDAPIDRYNAGDGSALSESALRGMALFNSEALECYHCHVPGFMFADAVVSEKSGAIERPFHNTGLYDTDGSGSYPAIDEGLKEISARELDMGRFRAPSLRNLRYTAPYMHDGSIATLDAVLDAYAAGGRATAGGQPPSRLRSSLVRGFSLSAEDRADLLAFLDALNDEQFVSNPALSDPFAQTR